ncbi:unnamed protein product [Owenia fusiformis]|uniref:Uncharacterized protein n=1 Tax=Owenia fusiformis TaxID=6347 RepID=A0A8J1TCV6_OWEFU|nr:unnamed protein product [Owenia fusiformis]
MAYLDKVMKFSTNMIQGIAEQWFIQRERKMSVEETLERKEREEIVIDETETISNEMDIISNNQEVQKLQESSENSRQDIHNLKRIVVKYRKEKRVLDGFISVVSCRIRHQILERGLCYCDICQDKSPVNHLSTYKRGSFYSPTIQEVR